MVLKMSSFSSKFDLQELFFGDCPTPTTKIKWSIQSEYIYKNIYIYITQSTKIDVTSG